jgi:hypothetical protein
VKESATSVSDVGTTLTQSCQHDAVNAKTLSRGGRAKNGDIKMPAKLQVEGCVIDFFESALQYKFELKPLLI